MTRPTPPGLVPFLAIYHGPDAAATAAKRMLRKIGEPVKVYARTCDRAANWTTLGAQTYICLRDFDGLGPTIRRGVCPDAPVGTDALLATWDWPKDPIDLLPKVAARIVNELLRDYPGAILQVDPGDEHLGT